MKTEHIEKKEAEQRLREISWQMADLEAEAQKLKQQVVFDERAKEREQRSHDKCECGHERGRHGKSFSINYTAGACRDCKCKNYLQK